MKSLSFRLLLLGSLSLLTPGCQKEEPSGASPAFDLALQLPSTLGRDQSRWERFQGRAQYLELICLEGGEERWRERYSPSTWERMHLPPGIFSVRHGLVLKASVWDVTKAGTLRSYPVLVGSKAISEEALSGPNPQVEIKLTLQVSVKEYD